MSDLAKRGEVAAYGRRHPVETKLRRGFHAAFRRLAQPESSAAIDALVFEPAVKTPAQLADLLARINWYLAGATVPIYVEGADDIEATPADAPNMDPSLVHRRAITTGLPPARARVRRVVHQITPRSVAAALPHARRMSVADPTFAYTSENGYYRLRAATCISAAPEPLATIPKLLEHAVAGGSALVLGTGPSAGEIDPASVDADVRILCNSAVRNVGLVDALDPTAICFADPVFHFGPSRYAAAFREDMRRAILQSNALAVVPDRYASLLLAHLPEIEDRLVSIDDTAQDWCWPSPARAQVRLSGNILTYLMLPVAFALVDRADIGGCDGRVSSERYFWRHNPEVQYSDDLMRDVFAAHPAFFASRDYGDYYERHLRYLDEFLAVGEAAGKTVRGVTSSHIPALIARGAPSLA